MGDFSGQILNEVSALRHIRPTSYLPINNVQLLSRLERGVGRPRVILFITFCILKYLIYFFFFFRMMNIQFIQNARENIKSEEQIPTYELIKTNTTIIFLVLMTKGF